MITGACEKNRHDECLRPKTCKCRCHKVSLAGVLVVFVLVAVAGCSEPASTFDRDQCIYFGGFVEGAHAGLEPPIHLADAKNATLQYFHELQLLDEWDVEACLDIAEVDASG